MGRITRVLTAPTKPAFPPAGLPATLERRRPRSYVEWKTLRQWGKLAAWEHDPAGYLLRELRETAGWTQRTLAARLDCSQQAIAQAERWESNPTVRFMRAWARALGYEMELGFRQRSGHHTSDELARP